MQELVAGVPTYDIRLYEQNALVFLIQKQVELAAMALFVHETYGLNVWCGLPQNLHILIARCSLRCDVLASKIVCLLQYVLPFMYAFPEYSPFQPECLGELHNYSLLLREAGRFYRTSCRCRMHACCAFHASGIELNHLAPGTCTQQLHFRMLEYIIARKHNC